MNLDVDHRPEAGRVPAGPSTPAKSELTSLVGGVLADLQKLVGQHLDLFHKELREDFRKTKEASLALAWAVGLGVLGGALLVSMLVGLLSWALPDVPWWGWCGILGSAAALAAVFLYFMGKKKFASFNPLPDESLAALRESAEQIANRLTSDRK